LGRFVKGDIVVLPFPFSDLSGTKRRPALVLASLDGDDIILCQITSQAKTDKYAITIETEDFTSGKLSVDSVICPNKIFTADESIVLYKACKINNELIEKVIKTFKNILLEI